LFRFFSFVMYRVVFVSFALALSARWWCQSWRAKKTHSRVGLALDESCVIALTHPPTPYVAYQFV
jgi:hypothetical protein